jgi:hypothetical protein
VLIGSATPDPRAILAEVAWQGEYRVAVVRVGTSSTPREHWATGTVAFDEQDELADRFTTAGFTIATLVGDLALHVPVQSPAPVTAPPPQSAPQSSAKPQSDRAAGRRETSAQAPRRKPLKLSLGGSVGQAMAVHDFRAGPWLTVAYAPFSVPAAMRVRGSTTFAEGAAASVRWTDLSAGVELAQPLGSARLTLFGAVEGGVSIVSASAETQDSRLTGLVCLLIGLELAIGGPLRAILASDLSLSPATHLEEPDGSTSHDRRAKLSGLAGLQVEL